MESTVINYMAPPTPYFIGCGVERYAIGERHINRYNIGLFDLVTVLKGALYIGEDDNKWKLEQQEAVILRPDLYHYGYDACTEETLIFWVHFHTVGVWAEHLNMQEYMQNLHYLKEKHRIYGIPSSFINPISLPKKSRLSDKALRYLDEIAQLGNEPRSIAVWKQQTVFQHLLQHLDCGQTLQQDITAMKIGEKTVQFIRENYQKPITNPILQEELNYHPNYIAKCMRAFNGFTPLEYLAYVRLEKSKRLLLNTDYSIEKISEEVGMELSTFSNRFKSKEGVSPLHYRKKYKR